MKNQERCRFTVPPRSRFLIWEVTRFCNLECRHCCTYSGPAVATDSDVSTDRMVDTARSLASIGVTEVLFSGGEPFLRKDMLQIISAIDPSHTEVFIASNGAPVTERLVSELKAARLAGIDVSLDGHTAELHAVVRKNHASFGQALAAIARCVEGGLPIRVTSVVVPETAPHVGALVAMLSNMGVPRIVFQTVLHSGGRAIEHPDLVLAPSQVEDIEQQIVAARSQFASEMDIDFRAGRSSGGASGCPAGHNLLNISADGDVSTCSWLYKIAPRVFTLGNIKEHSLDECLNNVTPMMAPWLERTDGCPIPLVEGIQRATLHVRT